MYCLSCGDCCLRMSPITGDGTPCPELVQIGDIYLCGIYANRPEECRNHTFPYRFCPIGLDKTNLDNSTSIAMRIDTVFELSKNIERNKK